MRIRARFECAAKVIMQPLTPHASLPVVVRNHGRDIGAMLQLVEKRCDGPAAGGMNHFRRDGGSRFEHKAPKRHPRMRDDETTVARIVAPGFERGSVRARCLSGRRRDPLAELGARFIERSVAHELIIEEQIDIDHPGSPAFIANAAESILNPLQLC
jgi:hypothetical protein